MVSVLRPGQRILNIPGYGVQTSRRAVQAAAAAGWWVVAGKTCVAAYQPKGAASLAVSYVNLNNPGTYDAAPGTAPTLDAAGWVFNGSTQYLTTGIVPASGGSMLVRFSDPGLYDNYLAGSSAGANKEIYVLTYPAANYVLYANGAGWVGSTPSLSSGVVGVAGNKAYRNGTAESFTIGAWSGGTTYSIYIGGYNNSGVAVCRPSKIQAFVFYSDTLTAGEVATVSAAMAAL